tara:strand:+ start:1304 stop:1930 length:627 start_codon:yes stop_codon:yes gene_type:complete
MYQTHAIACQKFSQRSADNLFKAVMMASSSIKQPWSHIGKQLKDIESLGTDSKYLFGFKRDTYLYMTTHKHKIHSQLLAVLNSKKTDDQKAESLMNIFLRVPGLGLAKAGFVCQLTAGLVGCMDSHNVKRYGVEPSSLNLNRNPRGKKALKTNATKVTNYISLCHKYGTENMWNSWCSFVATKDKQAKELWQDANHVSEVHYTYLIGE